jgi:uncharacterized protein (TIGR03382 family)
VKPALLGRLFYDATATSITADTVKFSSIPEPATTMLAAGLAMFGRLATRRRR